MAENEQVQRNSDDRASPPNPQLQTKSLANASQYISRCYSLHHRQKLTRYSILNHRIIRQIPGSLADDQCRESQITTEIEDILTLDKISDNICGCHRHPPHTIIQNKGIPSRPPGEIIYTSTTKQKVMATIPQQKVISIITIKPIVSLTPIEDIITTETPGMVITQTSKNHIITATAIDAIISGLSIQIIMAFSAINDIITSGIINQVISR